MASQMLVQEYVASRLYCFENVCFSPCAVHWCSTDVVTSDDPEVFNDRITGIVIVSVTIVRIAGSISKIAQMLLHRDTS